MYDLNQTAERQDFTQPIPPGLYRFKAKIKPGGTGENGLLRLAKNLRTQMLELELTVIGGKYAGRKIWDYVTVAADVSEHPDLASIDAEQADKFQTAARIGLAKVRDLIESANEIAHDDDSEEAQAIRKFDSLRVLDQLEFWALVEIKPGGNYKPRNVIAHVVTPDMAEWPGEAPQRPPLREEMEDEIPY